MKMAKATKEDSDAAMTIMQMLNAVEDGQFPPNEDGNVVDSDPVWFDQDDDEHLRILFRRLMAVMDSSPGCLLRVIGGMCGVILFEDNRIIDPDDDVLALHPSLVRRDETPAPVG